MLNIHRADNQAYLLTLDDQQLENLAAIFDQFKEETGQEINACGNIMLTVPDMKKITAIIQTLTSHGEAVVAFEQILNFLIVYDVEVVFLENPYRCSEQ